MLPRPVLARDKAADAGEPLLRTLDAVHLTSALSIRVDLTAFVAYDNRLIAAAEAAGIEPIWPSRHRPRLPGLIASQA